MLRCFETKTGPKRILAVDGGGIRGALAVGLIAKIESALRRLDDGSYGFCEETGEPISLKRLDARPIATLSIEAQERHERREKVYRDD